MPRVSVILPTHNRAAVLPRAVGSVLEQTFRDFELWIVDDGSTDGTPALRERWDDPRLRYLRTENRGPAAARNLACARASGEFLAFIDSDDEWLPLKLERQVAALDHHGSPVDAVCSAARWHVDHVDRTMLFPLRYAGVVRLFEDLLREASPLPFSSLLVRARPFRETGGFDETLPCAEDRDLLIRLARRSAFFALPEVLVIKHISGPMRSEALESKVAFEHLFLGRYEADLAGRPRARARAWMRIGGLQFRQGEWGKARAAFFTAVRAWPTHPAAYGYLAASLWLQLVARSRESPWSRWVRRLGWRGKSARRLRDWDGRA